METRTSTAKPPEDSPTDSGADDFETLVAEAKADPDGWKVRVERYDAENERQWMDTVPVDSFDLGTVRRRWGGGKYFFRLADPSGAWRKSKVERIAGAPKPADEPEPAPAAPSSSSGEGEPEPGSVQALARAVLELGRRFDSALDELRRPDPRHSNVNPAELLGSMMSAASTMNEPLREEVREMRRREREDERTGIDFFLRGWEMASRQQGGGGGYDSVVDRFGMPLLNWLQNQAGGGMEAPETGQQGGGVVTPPPVVVDPSKLPQVPGAPPPAWTRFLPPWIPRLFALADDGREPGRYAGVVLDEIPGGAYGMIAAELGREGFRDEFYAATQGAAQRKQWFDSFFDAALLELGPEDDGPE